MNSKSILLFVFFLFGIGLNAQNVFHDRNYWKTAPSVETVKSDEQKGNDATQLNANAFDATVYAIIEKAPDSTIKYLLSKSGNGVNKITHDGRTYIFWAAYVGNTDLMEFLQKNGAKTDIIEDHGYTIMNFAASTGQTDIKVYDLCIKFGANLKKDLDHDGANALLLASGSAKDMTLIDYFSSKGLDLKSTDANGNGILNYVSKNGNRDIMENLLKKGLKFTDNAMIMAAQGTRSNTNTLETYQFLESKGVKPTAISKNSENALHFIVRKEKQAETIAYFLSKGVDVNQTNKDGNNVLMYASAVNPDAVLVKMLVEKTKDINAKNTKGQSALSMAVQSNSAEIVGLLLEKGADTKIVDIDGNNLTYYLAQSYNPKKPTEFDTKLKALQSEGFDLNSASKNGNTLFHIAVTKNNLDLIKRAQGLGIDVNKKNAESMTALHKAAMISKNDEMLKYLVSIGAKTGEKTDMAETAYNLASENEALKQNKIAIDFLK